MISTRSIAVWVGIICLLFFWQLIFLFGHFYRGLGAVFSYGVIVPAALVDGSPVWYPSVAARARELRQSGVEGDGETVFDHALALEIKIKRLKRLAKTLGLTNKPTRDLDGLIAYSKAIEEALLKDSNFQQPALAKAEALRNNIIQLGMPFIEVAKIFSEDSTGPSGGDLGRIELTSAPLWLADASRFTVGEPTPVIDGGDSFWILLIREKGDGYFYARGVSVKKSNLGDELKRMSQELPALVLVW